MHARRTTLVVVLVALLMSAATSARADTVVIGSLNLPEGGTHQLCGGNPCTGMQGAVAPASAATYRLRSPVDGTITSWSFRNANVLQSNAYELRVLRPANPQEGAVRLVAVDRAGRVGSRSVKVRVPGTTPYFLQLKAPGRLSRRARQLLLTVAATQAGALRIGGRRFSVGRSPRRIRVPVNAGRRTLRLTLVLAAGGGRNRQLVVVPRR